MSGYAQIYRSLIGHPAFRNDAEAMTFAYMILRASWQAARVRYKQKAITLARGQLALSVRDLAEAMDRDKGWVERLLKRLKTETMIETRTETGVMVITICNYEEYQAPAGEGKTPAKTPRETRPRQGQDTEQRREKGKKEESPQSPPAGGRRGKIRFPDDWVLPAASDLPPKAKACAEQWTAESYDTHGEAFAAYWRGNGKMMVDWQATWANRVIGLHSQVMRDQKFGNAPTAAKGDGKPMSDADWNAFCDRCASNSRQLGRHDEAADWERKKRAVAPPRRTGSGRPQAIGDLVDRVAAAVR